MCTCFYPDRYVASIYDIPYEELWREGIRGLFFDIDNTMAPYDLPRPDASAIRIFQELTKMQFKICIMSNGKKARVTRFNENLNVPAVHRAGKPFGYNLRKSLKAMGLKPGQAAMIGDQVFTDVWAGNLMGMVSILVNPISEKDEWITKIKRGAEKIVLRRYRRLNPSPEQSSQKKK